MIQTKLIMYVVGAILVGMLIAYGYNKIYQSGYDKATLEWSIKLEKFKTDLQAKTIEEVERRDKINNQVKKREAETIAELQEELGQLQKTLKEQAIEASKDPDSDTKSLNDSSVMRINKIR